MRGRNIILIFLACFLLFGCSRSEDTITIGAILPLSGDNATYGEALKTGMDAALVNINSTGINGKRIKIIYEDSQGDPQAAVNSFNKLIRVDRVPLIIGDMFSNTTLALVPISQREQVVLLSPTASAIELTDAGEYFFRIYPSDSYDGSFLANFVFEQLDVRSSYIIYLQASSIVAVTNLFRDKFQEMGGEIIGMDGYNEGESDFRSILRRANNSGTEIIFIPGYLREMGTLLRQAKEMRVENKFVSISTFYDSEIFNIAQDAANGVLFSAPYFDTSIKSPEMIEFNNVYTEIFNQEPNILAGYGYDVVNIAVEAIKNSLINNSLSSENIKNSLFEIKNYPGVTGTTSFDSNGDVAKELRVMIAKDGNFVEYPY